ncbi:MAG: hypothetical protein KDB03_15780 [Planctomycetales bacterium]|nr:hypothetical protein [Planctomycetales bacterium]
MEIQLTLDPVESGDELQHSLTATWLTKNISSYFTFDSMFGKANASRLRIECGSQCGLKQPTRLIEPQGCYLLIIL